MNIRTSWKSTTLRSAMLRGPALAALVGTPMLGFTGCKEKPAETAKGAAPKGGTEREGKDVRADEVKLTAEAVERYGIKIAAVGKQVLIPVFTAPAMVSFNTEAMAHVGSPLRGRVTDIKVRLGDSVNKGDTLLVVECPELGEAQSDYLQKQTAAQTAAPAVALARSAYDRAKALYDKSQGISLTELQKREAELRVAEASLQAAQAAVTAADNRLRVLGMDETAVASLSTSGQIEPHLTITAPIAGQVVQREVTLGELVSPDKEALLVLADRATLWVLADVPEARLPAVVAGAKVSVVVGMERAGSGEPIRGTVALISPAVDPSTRSAQVRVEVRGAPATLRPGMFVQVEIQASAPDGKPPEPVLAVPDEAVQTIEGVPAVFVPVAGEENTFVKRPISIGRAVGGMVPVLSGLKEGEPVVTAGSFILKAELGKAGAREGD